MAHCLTSVGHCGYFCSASMIWLWSSMSLMSWYSLCVLEAALSSGRISSSCCRCSKAWGAETMEEQAPLRSVLFGFFLVISSRKESPYVPSWWPAAQSCTWSSTSSGGTSWTLQEKHNNQLFKRYLFFKKPENSGLKNEFSSYSLHVALTWSHFPKQIWPLQLPFLPLFFWTVLNLCSPWTNTAASH